MRIFCDETLLLSSLDNSQVAEESSSVAKEPGDPGGHSGSTRPPPDNDDGLFELFTTACDLNIFTFDETKRDEKQPMEIDDDESISVGCLVDRQSRIQSSSQSTSGQSNDIDTGSLQDLSTNDTDTVSSIDQPRCMSQSGLYSIVEEENSGDFKADLSEFKMVDLDDILKNDTLSESTVDNTSSVIEKTIGESNFAEQSTGQTEKQLSTNLAPIISSLPTIHKSSSPVSSVGSGMKKSLQSQPNFGLSKKKKKLRKKKKHVVQETIIISSDDEEEKEVSKEVTERILRSQTTKGKESDEVKQIMFPPDEDQKKPNTTGTVTTTRRGRKVSIKTKQEEAEPDNPKPRKGRPPKAMVKVKTVQQISTGVRKSSRLQEIEKRKQRMKTLFS